MPIPSIDDDEVFELTNIKVREVSLVDRAANKRKFLVTKRDRKSSKDEITVDEVAKVAERAVQAQAGTLAADLDRKDAEEAAAAAKAATGVPAIVEAAVEANEEEIDKALWSTAEKNKLPDSSFLYVGSGGKKDYEGKTEPRSLRKFPYKNGSGEIDMPHLRNAAARIPDSKLPEDVKSRLKAKVERLLGNAKKALDLVAKDDGETVYSDGDIQVNVVVSPAGQDETETPAGAAFEAKMQAAWTGAIEALQGRLDMMKEEAAKLEGCPAMHIWYMTSMLSSMYDIGGPEWEIEVAATNAAKAKGKDVTKREEALARVAKSMSAAKMTKLKAVHKQLCGVQKDFDAIMQDIGDEPVTAGSTTTGAYKNERAADSVANPAASITAPIVAPVAAAVVPAAVEALAFDISQDPAFKALQASFRAQEEKMATLNKTVAAQDAIIAKARSSVRSNALTPESVSKQNEVKWERDMGSSSRFGR